MTSIKKIAPWVAAAAIAGALGLAPVASAATPPVALAPGTTTSVGNAGTDPLVPSGSDPYTPYRLGYINSNHDEANTTNGQLDVPF